MAKRTITGTDGHVAVYDDAGTWKTFHISEVYTGGPGLNRYVPKIGDHIVDDTGPTVLTYKVNSLDLTTLITTWIRIHGPCECDNGVDKLIQTKSKSYFAYLDTSVTPHVLAVCDRILVGGTMSDYAKIFRGTDASDAGKVVSFLYDNNGNFLTQNVPLELAAVDSHVNHTLKTVAVCSTNEKMKDGEYLTLVIYTDDGHVVDTELLIVINTSFIRGLNASQKYIKGITLKSPYLSQADDHTIEYPINTPMDSANFMGLVHYSDGSVRELPVDGTKFQLFGLEDFISTVPGQNFPLSLIYTLSQGEVTYNAMSGEGKHLAEPYDMITINQNGNYVVKLFAYPVWVDNNTGYRLRWFMYNLDRVMGFEVTPFVQYNMDTDVYDGKAYGKIQHLSVRVNLRDVSATMRSYIHTQKLDIILNDAATARTTNWTIGFEPAQMPRYGNNLHARLKMYTASNFKINLGSDINTLDEWINRVYYDTKPLINLQKEVKAPEPNYFAILVGTSRYEFPITAWNTDITIAQSLDINGTLFVEFIKKTPVGDAVLGVSGLPIYEM